MQLGDISKLLFSLLVLVGLSSCDEAANKRPLIISANSWIGYEPLYWADSLNDFPKNSVHVVETPISLALLQAFRGATIDASALSLSRALTWSKREVDQTIVAVLAASHGADQIIARSTIASMSDLRGMRVGVELGTVNEYLLRRALEIHDIDAEEIILLDAPLLNLIELYQSGALDALVGFGDSLRDVEEGSSVIFTSADIPGEILDVLSVRNSYYKRNPDRVADLLRGWIKSVERFNSWPDDQPLPAGSKTRALFKKDFAEIRFLSAEEMLNYFENDGQKMRALLAKRQKNLTGTNSVSPMPNLSDTAIKAALNPRRSTGEN